MDVSLRGRLCTHLYD